jgi:hypothetical protein
MDIVLSKFNTKMKGMNKIILENNNNNKKINSKKITKASSKCYSINV